MTNSKNTKRALFSSAVAILLCCTMLLGTTFAWFTDTAQSQNNVIQAGNLDMKVSYINAEMMKNNEDWKVLEAESKVFNENALYEPGYTEAVWIKVENAGSLAFRYQLSLDVISETLGVNQAGDNFELSNYLVAKTGFGTADYENDKVAYNTRDSLNNFAFTDDSLSDGTAAIYNNAVLWPENNADGNPDTWYYLVVLQMPTTVGNEANHDGTHVPKIELGLTAVATQVPHENDSYDAGYDANAAYPDKPVLGPKADVTAWPEDENMPVVNGVELETAYVFKTTQTADEARGSEYAKWHADFVVYTDKDVADDTIMLAGNYGTYGWLGFENEDYPVEAGQEIRLLGDIGALLNNGNPVYMNYEELCSIVQTFKCGVTDISGTNALDGTTLTVELRLYEVAERTPENNSDNTETGKFIVIGSYDYTF